MLVILGRLYLRAKPRRPNVVSHARAKAPIRVPVISNEVTSSRNGPLRRALHAPRRLRDEVIRLRQRHLWRVIGNGFTRPWLDRWGFLRERRFDGINRLRGIAGLTLMLQYRPGPVPDGHWSPRRINTLVRELRLRSYLEIGVFEGETFVDVVTRRRYGVDPSPLFDAVYLPHGAKFAVMTSDEFFATIRRSKRFDVAFVDGLHTMEQTYRDVINVFAHLRHGAVLIDDTVPIDEISAIPDRAESYRQRDAAGLEGRPWHGDVWRVVTLLERHHPELEWRTIIDEGNPQTLVWRRRRGTIVRAASDAAITRAQVSSYAEEFADGVPTYFHATSESSALSECVRSLRRGRH